MSNRAAFVLALVSATAATPGPVCAQEGDARVRIVDYVADTVVAVDGAPGFQTTIELAPDETIRTVALGDSSAWAVTVDRSGNRIYLKPAQTEGATNMTVVTNARRYLFDLGAGRQEMSYVLRFRYVPQATEAPIDPSTIVGHYRMSGDRALRPQAIYDDGTHTFIEWPAEASLPAVYAIDRLGREAVINGAMRGRLYVLDSISQALVFRIDRHVARAERRPVQPS